MGGYSLNTDWAEAHGLDAYDEGTRTNEDVLCALMLGEDINGMCAKLELVKIPDNATDYTIIEHDGFESVLYVVDGKIHRL